MNKRIRSIPCHYRAQLKSWSLSEFFAEWIKETDRKFSIQERRKVALIIDNCSDHQNVENLKWVEFMFFLQNTTVITQPVHQGVIRSLKATYRWLAVKKHIVALDKGKEMSTFSILTAMFMLIKARKCIPEQIRNNRWNSTEGHKRWGRFLGGYNGKPKKWSGHVEKKIHCRLWLHSRRVIDFDLHIYIANKTAEEDIIPEVSGHEAFDVR